jgi:hypothetical protein
MINNEYFFEGMNYFYLNRLSTTYTHVLPNSFLVYYGGSTRLYCLVMS